MSVDDKKELKEILDDEDIRKYFQSRDPNRKLPNPGLTEETADELKGKASVLKPKEEKEDAHGISFTQYIKGIKETLRRGILVGISIGLFLAIILTLFLR